MAEVKPEDVAVPKKSAGVGRVLATLAVVLLLVGVVVAVGVAVYLGVQWNDTTQRLDQAKADLSLVQRTLEKKIATLEDTTAQLTRSQEDLTAAQGQVNSLTADLSTANAGLKDLQDWKAVVVCEKTRDFPDLVDAVAVSQQLAAFFSSNYSLDVIKVTWGYYEITISSDMKITATYLYDIQYRSGTSTIHKFVMAYNFGDAGLQGVFSMNDGCWIDPPTKR